METLPRLRLRIVARPRPARLAGAGGTVWATSMRPPVACTGRSRLGRPHNHVSQVIEIDGQIETRPRPGGPGPIDHGPIGEPEKRDHRPLMALPPDEFRPPIIERGHVQTETTGSTPLSVRGRSHRGSRPPVT